MTNDQNPDYPAVESQKAQEFYAGAIPRMLRMLLVAGVLLIAPAFWLYGWRGALGFAAGIAVSYVNFRALVGGVEGLTDRVANRNSREKGGVILTRFAVRYGLVAIVAYAIVKGSSPAFRGFLWGLCLPVAAMMIEAAAEAYVAFRRD